MTPAARRYRRRVIAMLNAREQALDDIWEKTSEVQLALRATRSIRSRIEAMR
jgi:hypothetical protein